MSHPNPSILRLFLQALTVADAGLVLHLLECPRCSRQCWGQLSPRPVRRRPGEPRSPTPPPERYDRILARLAGRMGRTVAQMEKGRRKAELLVAELLAAPPGERYAYLAANQRFRTVFVAWTLLEQSWQKEDGGEAEMLARLAASIAQKLAARASGTGIEAGLAIAAWCAAGEAGRRAGRPEDAEDALMRAIPYLERSIDPSESAEYCHALARVRRDQERFDEARALLERAAVLFGSAGQTQDQALALDDLAAVCLDQGKE